MSIDQPCSAEPPLWLSNEWVARLSVLVAVMQLLGLVVVIVATFLFEAPRLVRLTLLMPLWLAVTLTPVVCYNFLTVVRWVRVDSKGIRARFVFGERTYPWHQIREVLYVRFGSRKASSPLVARAVQFTTDKGVSFSAYMRKQDVPLMAARVPPRSLGRQDYLGLMLGRNTKVGLVLRAVTLIGALTVVTLWLTGVAR